MDTGKSLVLVNGLIAKNPYIEYILLGSNPAFFKCDTMKTSNLLFMGILVGLVLFGFFEFFGINPTYGGIIGAVIVGTLIGKTIGKGSEKYAFFSIFMYNLIGLMSLFLFTSDGKLALQYGGIALSVLIGFALMMVFFYSMIGSFGAFVASNLSRNKQDEGL
ncbi:MAG: hypothetical protein PHG79_12650 [Methanosarcina sp.]|nr:hypothetical protein [Methanosarcina sp.]